MSNCWSIGYKKDDGSFVLLLTVNNNSRSIVDNSGEGLDSEDMAEMLAVGCLELLENNGLVPRYKLLCLARQDSPDEVDLDG